MPLSTCVHPDGTFIFGIHKPHYTVQNQRIENRLSTLGRDGQGDEVDNSANLPEGDIQVEGADWVYEIANPFPFKGVTYINKRWADASAGSPERFILKEPPKLSLHDSLGDECEGTITKLPSALCLSLATTTTDPWDLILLAQKSCEFEVLENDSLGLLYEITERGQRAVIHDSLLFEAVANNIHLPDKYKIAMVIRPGAQGDSPITAEWQEGESHAYEYLRSNSYIAGGHYAANMAEDAIRYKLDDFTEQDIRGLRRLYYQRSFLRLAKELKLSFQAEKELLTEHEIEQLRLQIVDALQHRKPESRATLWGWNFGFDYAASGYRLHASHQQIHQQYALIPQTVDAYYDDNTKAQQTMQSYACGDLLADVIGQYKDKYDRDYFRDYEAALNNNRRMDGREDLPSSLIIHKDENVIVFVPKAQTSQWEVQVMATADKKGLFVGNILEASESIRDSFDKGIFIAQQALAGLGAKMVTSIEYSKPLGEARNQPLIYALLPRLPESPGAFSENQMRFINGHFPEDFARALRKALSKRNMLLVDI